MYRRRRPDTQQPYGSDGMVTEMHRSLHSTVSTVAKIEVMRAAEQAYWWRVWSHSTNGCVKGKGRPVTCHEGTEWEGRYSPTLSLTWLLGGGGWWTPRPGRFIPGNGSVSTVQEAEWAPGPVWRVRKISPPLGFDPRTVQPVTSCYSDRAIAAHILSTAHSRI
jgi:hypothetical protein